MKSNMKILLTQPLWPRKVQFGHFGLSSGNNTFSYGMASIAAYCKKKKIAISIFDPILYDDGVVEQFFIKYIHSHGFDVIGMPCYTASVDYVFNTAKVIKSICPECRVVLGGIHPTILPEETLKECRYVDYLVLGEGEETFYELIQVIEGRLDLGCVNGLAYRENNTIKINQRRGLMNPQEFPITAYELFALQKYVPAPHLVKNAPAYVMVTQRGCPFKCTFCNANEIHGDRVRCKPVGMVIEEILYLIKHYGARGIIFYDSTFTVNHKWVNELCEQILNKNLRISWYCGTRTDMVNKDLLKAMKRAGCFMISYGIESASQRTLKLIEKCINIQEAVDAVNLTIRLGFRVCTMYILGLPRENREDVLKTVELAKKISSHIAFFFLPTPFPKTKLYYDCQKDGGLRKDIKWSDYNMTNFSDPVYINPAFSLEEYKGLINYAYKSYYTCPKVIFRNLSKLNNLTNAYNISKAFMAMSRFIFGKVYR